MTKRRACERKPPWLRFIASAGNASKLEADICGTCSRWIIRCKQGVWESYDPGIVMGDDLTVAIILGRRLTRLEPIYGVTSPRLIDVCGERGIKPDGKYLAEHQCWREPISSRPYKPPRVANHQTSWGKDIDLNDEDLKKFTRIWQMPVRRLACSARREENSYSNGQGTDTKPMK